MPSTELEEEAPDVLHAQPRQLSRNSREPRGAKRGDEVRNLRSHETLPRGAIELSGVFAGVELSRKFEEASAKSAVRF